VGWWIVIPLLFKVKMQEMHRLQGANATISCIASRSALIVTPKSTDKVGFPFGCPEYFRRPRVVHSLFKEYFHAQDHSRRWRRSRSRRLLAGKG
jgi:hypothetical protein